MKSVYEASSALEAYMILNLLQQEGIRGRVDGEYLPGAVGELQAINLVRVMVDAPDYEKARQLIEDWEAIQVDRERQATGKRSGPLSGFLFGLVIGGGLVFWACSTPVAEDGIDVNGDGVLDERWTYRNNRLRKIELDRNLDGRIDSIRYYDRKGMPERTQADDDFDGVFETNVVYENGLVRLQESDLNQDGGIDHRSTFRYGICTRRSDE